MHNKQINPPYCTKQCYIKEVRDKCSTFLMFYGTNWYLEALFCEKGAGRHPTLQIQLLSTAGIKEGTKHNILSLHTLAVW